MKFESIGNVIVNCATASGGKIVTPSAMTGIVRGMELTGTGIPAGAYVTEVYSTTIEISQAATATNAAVSLSFNAKPRYMDGFTVGYDKADYGATAFATYTPPICDNGVFEMRYVESTNGTAPGKRLYVNFLGTWYYASLT